VPTADLVPSVLPAPTPCPDHDGGAHLVRVFEAGDRARLEDFYDEFEPKRAAQGLPPTGADRVRRWLDGVLSAGLHLVVETEAEISGHALLIDTGRPGEAEYAIFLRADIRGRGVGTCVNRLAVHAGRAAGWTRLWLSVEPHNRAAIRSYQKVGFRYRAATVFLSEAEMELELGPPAPA
jgi:RimJ/RimL family protein N-acetyltransferase